MKKLLLGCGLGVFLVGCAAPTYNATPQRTKVSKPPLNVVTTVGVGEQMVTQGTVVEDEGLVVNNSAKVMGYTVHPGQYKKTGQNEKGKYFSPVSTTGGIVEKSFMADPFQVIMVTADRKLCVVSVFNAKFCQDNADFQIQNISSASKDSFQQTLIYSGKIGSKVNIGYREFSNDTARPAFNNDVEYDLSESKQIGYKGALIDIVSANNQSITYKVLKNFNTQ